MSKFRSSLPRNLSTSLRNYSSTTKTSPRHFLTIADLTPAELSTLIRNAASRKSEVKSNEQSNEFRSALQGQTIALTFNKRSTRTRVSTEAAVVAMGGTPMFLGNKDIQLGINESLKDTSIVLSSMVSGIVARVGPHSDIKELAEHSTKPIISGLCNDFHPLQSIADFLTITEAYPSSGQSLGLEGLKIAWVGDSNNVLFDLAIASAKLGVNIAVASPNGYGIPDRMRQLIESAAETAPKAGTITETTVPEEAVKDADIIVTDTWISMGQEDEIEQRLEAFDGYQVTNELAERGGAKSDWKFMHCLPRHREEVNDEVFYGPNSLVFPEAENRLWAAIASIEAFIVNKGRIE